VEAAQDPQLAASVVGLHEAHRAPKRLLGFAQHVRLAEEPTVGLLALLSVVAAAPREPQP
jgi:hypothetical protein